MSDEDVQKTIAALEQKRAARKAATASARAEQYAKDLEQIDALETEHGDDRVSVLSMSSFVAGLPTVVVVKTPEAAYVKRYRQQVRSAAGEKKQNVVKIGDALDQLAASALAYPTAEIYERMKEEWPAIHDNVGREAIRLGEAEGKD